MHWYSNPTTYSAIAAALSCLVAGQSYLISKKNFEFNKMTAKRNLINSLAERCNKNVNEKGHLPASEGVISNVYTVCLSAKEELSKVKDPNEAEELKSYFWLNLHSSIWAEIKDSDKLSQLEIQFTHKSDVLSMLRKQQIELKNFFISKV